MNRHKRNGPGSATNTHPSHNPVLVKVRVHTDYSEADDIATAAIAQADADLPDFETGWRPYVQDGKPAGFVAFLRPWHENWYDLYHFDNWVEAISRAVSLTKTRPNCLYVGGPSA